MINWVKLERKRRKLERKYEYQMGVIFRKQLRDYQRALDRNLLDAVETPDPYFSKGIKEIYEKMIRETVGEFENKFEELEKDIVKSKWEQMIDDYLSTIGAERITEIISYTKKYVVNRLKPILREGVANGDSIAAIGRKIISDIDEYKKGFSTYRAERIARTEIVGSSNWASFGSVQAAGLSDKVRKKWSAREDGREREAHREMNSKEAIPLNDKFEVRRLDGGFDLMEFPGDPRGSAGNVINCRCAIIYERI